jgi:hypothetical protein
MKRIPTLALPTTLLALTLLAGCGGDDSSTEADAGTEPDAASIDDAIADQDAATEDPLTDPTSPTEPASDLPDPCVLLSADEAAAVVGEPVESTGAVPQLGTEGLECTYAAVSGSSLAIQLTAGREAYDIEREQGTGGFSDAGDTQDISGLGEDAYVGIGSYGPVKISWFQDDLALTVQISDVGATEPRSVEEFEDLAHQISDRVA